MNRIFSLLWGIALVALSAISCTFAYTQEQREAYEWAYKYKITTQPNIEAAKLNWNLTRQAFAKMVVNYLENVVGVKPSASNTCYFPDESKITNNLKPYARKTCALDIMWSNWKNFNPTKPLSRAQLGTVLSRILWWDEHDASGEWYYIYHVNALKDAGIMNNIRNVSNISAKRWDVLIMLKRMYDKFGSNVYINWWESSIYNTDEMRINNAVDYNDQIVDLSFNCIMSETETFNDTGSTIEEIRNATNNVISECSKSYEEISKIWDRHWDSSLKDWVLNLIKKEIIYYSKLKELLPYLEKDELTDEENIAYENIYAKLESIDKELVQANEDLVTIQEQFSKNYRFEIESNNNDEISSNDPGQDTSLYSNQNIIYVWKDWTTYNYDSGFIDLLIKTADKKWESDLVAFLKIESEFLKDWLELGNFDKEEFFKELWIDLDNVDKDKLTKTEKEEIADNFGKWVEKLMNQNKDMNNKFIKDLKNVVDKIWKTDKFWLKEKYETSKDYIEFCNSYLDKFGEMIANLVRSSITAEEGDNNDEAMGQALWIIWMSIANKSKTDEYQTYLNSRWINAIKLLGWELIE